MKKLSKEFVAGLEKAFENVDFKQAVSDAELADKNGTFKTIISTEDRDRAGEIIKIDAWELSRYKKNPIVLFAHNYYNLPVGKATKVYIEGKRLIAEGIFAGHEEAQILRRMYDDGILKTTSVGFIAKGYDEKDDSIITKAELLEFSFVPVPANPEALALEKGYSSEEVATMAKKGFFDFENMKTRDQEQDEESGEDEEEDEVETCETCGNPTDACTCEDEDEDPSDEDLEDIEKECPKCGKKGDECECPADEDEGTDTEKIVSAAASMEKSAAAMAAAAKTIEDLFGGKSADEDDDEYEDEEDEDEEVNEDEVRAAFQTAARNLSEALHKYKKTHSRKQ